MKRDLNTESPWRLTVLTEGAAYAQRIYGELAAATARAGLTERITLRRVYRTVTADGTVGALTYLVHSGRALVLHAQSGEVARIVLEPVTEGDEA